MKASLGQDVRSGVSSKSGAGRLLSCVRLGLIACVISALAACAATYRNHGYVPTEQDLAELQVGKSTQEDVAFAIGRPSAIGVLAGSGWYYVGSRFKQLGLRAPQEVDRQVVAISFDDKNVVKNIERFGLKDGEVITISRRVTDSNVKGLGFLRQLLGNLGNISAADVLRDQ